MTDKILIVDDSRTILKMNKRVLETVFPGYEIVAFNEPVDAVEAIKESKDVFYFALLDYNMRILNGVELATALVEMEHNPISYSHTGLVSANIQDAVQEKANALGMEFVPKPLNVEKLKAFLDSKNIGYTK